MHMEIKTRMLHFHVSVFNFLLVKSNGKDTLNNANSYVEAFSLMSVNISKVTMID